MTLPVYPSAIYGRSYNVVKSPEFKTLISASDGDAETAIGLIVNPRWHFRLIYEQLFNDLTNPAYNVSELEELMGFYNSQGGRFGTFLLDDPEDDTVRGPIGAAAIGSSAGTGFAPGDTLSVIGGGGKSGVLTVGTVGGGGAILTFTVGAGGNWYASTTNAQLAVLSSAAGAGAPTANITAVTTLQLVNDGATSRTYYSPIQRNLGSQFLEDVTDLNPQDGSGLSVWANGVLQAGGGTNYTLLGPGLAIPGYSFQGMYLKWAAAPTAPITAAFGWYFRVRFEDDKSDFEKFLLRLWTIGGAEGKSGAGMVKLKTRKPIGT